ncbi:MAG: NYN domain-containing protein [Longimicrobiales bacterium]
MNKSRTFVYIDGFNLYYRAVKDTPYKWLDLGALCQKLLPKNDVQRIKYFTSRVTGKIDPDQPVRQQTFLRALATLPKVEVIFGQFYSNTCRMPLAKPAARGPRTVEVIKTEEKGSDVNIAAHMVHDAHKGRYETAVLVSNDSDLREAVRIVRRECGLNVGIIYPAVTGMPSRALVEHASFVKQIRIGLLQSCQFPEQMEDSHGAFHKPAAWP